MRLVKILAVVLGIVVLIPVSVLLIGALFQSYAGIAAVVILFFLVGSLRWVKNARSPGKPDRTESLRLSEAPPPVGPDGEMRERPRYSDHIRTGGSDMSGGGGGISS